MNALQTFLVFCTSLTENERIFNEPLQTFYKLAFELIIFNVRGYIVGDLILNHDDVADC